MARKNTSPESRMSLTERLDLKLRELDAAVRAIKQREVNVELVKSFIAAHPVTRRDLQIIARTLSNSWSIPKRSDKGSMTEIVNKNGVVMRVKTGKQPARYRHPTDSSVTWTGIARRPPWVVEYLAKGGRTLDDLLIPGQKPIRPGHISKNKG